ncbi:MAG: cytochrome C peroxidase, partial [Betaproteobacteria bacterium]
MRPKGSKPYAGARADLVKAGELLWSDTRISTNGMSCNTCHKDGAAFSASFAKPYPHAVAMAQRQSKLKSITMEQMVQFCMVVPMAAKPLAWDSKELAALTAYTGEVQ